MMRRRQSVRSGFGGTETGSELIWRGMPEMVLVAVRAARWREFEAPNLEETDSPVVGVRRRSVQPVYERGRRWCSRISGLETKCATDAKTVQQVVVGMRSWLATNPAAPSSVATSQCFDLADVSNRWQWRWCPEKRPRPVSPSCPSVIWQTAAIRTVTLRIWSDGLTP